MDIARYGWPGLHAHAPRPHYDDPWAKDPRWLDPYSRRCCEFCDTWNAIPDLDDTLQDLYAWDPYYYAQVRALCEGIHGHYMMGYDRDGPESFFLAREVERLARMLGKVYRGNPWAGRGLGDVAARLKIMGREVQVGRRRRRCHTFDRPPYHGGRCNGW